MYFLCIVFVLTLYKNSPFINNKLFTKVLQNYVKHAFRDVLSFSKKLIYKEKGGRIIK